MGIGVLSICEPRTKITFETNFPTFFRTWGPKSKQRGRRPGSCSPPLRTAVVHCWYSNINIWVMMYYKTLPFAPNRCTGAWRQGVVGSRPTSTWAQTVAGRTSSGHLRSCSFVWTPADAEAASSKANRWRANGRSALAVCPWASAAAAWWRSWAAAAGTTAARCATRPLRRSTVPSRRRPPWTCCNHMTWKKIQHKTTRADVIQCVHQLRGQRSDSARI